MKKPLRTSTKKKQTLIPNASVIPCCVSFASRSSFSQTPPVLFSPLESADAADWDFCFRASASAAVQRLHCHGIKMRASCSDSHPRERVMRSTPVIRNAVPCRATLHDLCVLLFSSRGEGSFACYFLPSLLFILLRRCAVGEDSSRLDCGLGSMEVSNRIFELRM